ncbi:hypothetical protein [Streptomyces sp. NPDC001843]|uniref:hypothetical protein n=1 Tax=Streptomyces sp. NPDC001843 TaxID=3364617 RepID=UPI003684F1BE
MGGEEHVCRVCGRPLETVIRRHKTLGAWVPVWVPGPCRNPDCPAAAEAAPGGRRRPPAPHEGNDATRRETGP